MATQIYLGNPPEHIVNWINNNVITFTPETKVIYSDGTSKSFLIEGELLMDSIPNSDSGALVQKLIIGTAVTRISSHLYATNDSLQYVAIPSSVYQIDYGAFSYCINLKEVYCYFDSSAGVGQGVFSQCSSLRDISFKNLTIAQVKSMTSYSTWLYDLNPLNDYDFIVHCKDGNFIIRNGQFK